LNGEGPGNHQKKTNGVNELAMRGKGGDGTCNLKYYRIRENEKEEKKGGWGIEEGCLNKGSPKEERQQVLLGLRPAAHTIGRDKENLKKWESNKSLGRPEGQA